MREVVCALHTRATQGFWLAETLYQSIQTRFGCGVHALHCRGQMCNVQNLGDIAAVEPLLLVVMALPRTRMRQPPTRAAPESFLLPITKAMSKPDLLHHDAKETQLNMAKLSWIAYQSPEDVARMYESARKTPDKLDDKWSPLTAATEPPQYATCLTSDAQAYAFKMGCCPRAPLVLACRGTSSLQDAVVDASLAQVPFKFADGKEKDGVCVHQGFYQQFKGIMPQVDALYKGHLAGGGMLICTGHSLGSAVAALAAMFYGQQYPKQVVYLGLGTPPRRQRRLRQEVRRYRVGPDQDRQWPGSRQQDTSPSGLLAHRNGGPSRQVRPLPGDTCPDGSPGPQYSGRVCTQPGDTGRSGHRCTAVTLQLVDGRHFEVPWLTWEVLWSNMIMLPRRRLLAGTSGIPVTGPGTPVFRSAWRPKH